MKRKKSGLTQEAVAEKLGVSRQTISKWETDETLPDICQSKRMAQLYHVTLDELIDFDIDVKEIEQLIEKTSEETQAKIDWTAAWGKKYPILVQYQNEVHTSDYAARLTELLDSLRNDYIFISFSNGSGSPIHADAWTGLTAPHSLLHCSWQRRSLTGLHC